jgi:diguanylate cyclase with GGDEF domain
MRIIGRNDAFLLGGLAIAVWVVSSRELGTLLDRAREIDHSRGLQLVPGLFILTVVFLIHLFRKREEMRGEANAAKTRVAEMDLLVQSRFNDQTLVVTASFGIAEVIAADDTSNTIIAHADAALYHAKQDGRNCGRTSRGRGSNVLRQRASEHR